MRVVKEIIKQIVLSIKSTGIVDTWTDNTGSYTIGTTIGNLQAGFKVVLIYADTTLNRDVVITSITDDSFTFTGTGISEPLSWEMAIYFEVGNRVELNKKYLNKAKSLNKRVQEYPLVWLYTNFREVPSEFTSIHFTTDLTLALADFSERNLYEEDRLTNKYKPVLYPYFELLKQAFNTRPNKDYFAIPWGQKGIEFTNMDFPYFGSQDQKENVLPEITDAIEFEVALNWRKEYTSCLI